MELRKRWSLFNDFMNSSFPLEILRRLILYQQIKIRYAPQSMKRINVQSIYKSLIKMLNRQKTRFSKKISLDKDILFPYVFYIKPNFNYICIFLDSIYRAFDLLTMRKGRIQQTNTCVHGSSVKFILSLTFCYHASFLSESFKKSSPEPVTELLKMYPKKTFFKMFSFCSFDLPGLDLSENGFKQVHM